MKEKLFNFLIILAGITIAITVSLILKHFLLWETGSSWKLLLVVILLGYFFSGTAGRKYSIPKILLYISGFLAIFIVMLEVNGIYLVDLYKTSLYQLELTGWLLFVTRLVIAILLSYVTVGVGVTVQEKIS